MSWETVHYDRKTLYSQIWSEPVSRVAKTYGVTDVALAKVCRKLRVPVPGRGYWAKKQAGKEVKQVPLPPLRAGEPETIKSERRVSEGPAPAVSPREKEIMDREAGTPRITVVNELLQPHTLVRQARAAFRWAKPGFDGLLTPKRYDRLAIRVGPDSLDRALRIMDALIRALRSRKVDVWIADEHGHPTFVTVEEENIRINLTEKLNRRERKLTPQEKRKLAQGRWISDRFSNEPSGQLRFRIHSEGRSYRSVSRQWADGKKKKLEHRLNDIVVGLYLEAEARKEQRRQDEIAAKRREKEWQRECERRERQRQEQQRFDNLLKEVDAWHRSRRIRAYLDAVRRTAIEKHGMINAGSELDQWLSWAERRAKQIDPLDRE